MSSLSRVMKTPHLNISAFQTELDKLIVNANSADIKSRSEVRLEDSEKRLSNLDDELAETRESLTRTRNAISELEKLKVLQEANEVDITAERLAILAEINSLRESGVRVRAKKEASDDHE